MEDNSEEIQPTEANYYEGKKPGRVYVSKRLTDKFSDGSTRPVRIISQVIDAQESWIHANLKNEEVLRITPGNRQQIVAKIYEDTREIFALSLQRFQKNPSKEFHFTFIGDEISTLKNFIDSIAILDFSDPNKYRTETAKINEIKAELLRDPNIGDFITEALRSNITKYDLVAVAYRKEQLEIFRQLLISDEYFNKKKSEWNKTKNEDVWQCFFEANPWIFGYGLNFIFNEALEGERLETVVKGADITSSGKRTDALLKSRGIINSICIVEIKTHKTDLLQPMTAAYRPECWRTSTELSGGIAQVQKTVHKTVENLGSIFRPTIATGEPTGEELHLYKPKAYLIAGSLKEFKNEYGVNQEKLSSFELFRKSLNDIEIITFDELYERARWIVQNNEKQSS